jgi:transcriptional regulator with XRE-family HTH domain
MRFTTYKKVRLECGLLQVELAQRARIDRSRLSLIENAHLIPSAEEIQRIAKALNVSVETLTPAAAADLSPPFGRDVAA